MSYMVKSGGVDISDYVIDCGLVPAVQRNRDFTLVLSEIDIILSGKVASYLHEVGREITIASTSNSSYPFYVGKISERKYNYEQRGYHLQVRNVLADLQNHTLNYQSLHSALVAGATQQQYRAIDNNGYPSVQLLWIIQKIFEIVDIEILLPSSLMEIVRFNFGASERIIQLQHLRIDENMLYCINQRVATNHSNIDADPEKLLEVPTFFDFFQWFISSIGNVEDDVIGFNVRWSTTGTPKQLHLFTRDETPVVLNDDNAYGRQDSNVVGDVNGYSYNVQFRGRVNYTTTAEETLTEFKTSSGLGKTDIAYPTNLIIMYEKYWIAAGEVFGLSDYPLYVYPARTFLSNGIKEITRDYDVKNLVTDSSITTRAKESNVDLIRQEAEIIQELL